MLKNYSVNYTKTKPVLETLSMNSLGKTLSVWAIYTVYVLRLSEISFDSEESSSLYPAVELFFYSEFLSYSEMLELWTIMNA